MENWFSIKLVVGLEIKIFYLLYILLRKVNDIFGSSIYFFSVYIILLSLYYYSKTIDRI